MRPVNMSSKAIDARLRRVAQLRRLCLSLQKVKLPEDSDVVPTAQTEVSQTSSKQQPDARIRS